MASTKTFRLAGAVLVSGLVGGSLVLLNPDSAQAAACGSASYTIAQLTAPGFNCFIGDKIYSEFTFTGITDGNYSFTNPTPSTHTFTGTSLAFTGGTPTVPISFSYGYKMALYNAVPGQEFALFRTGITSSDLGVQDFDKVLTANGNVTVAANATADSSVSPGAVIPFSAGETGPITFNSVVTLRSGVVDQFTDTVGQKLTAPPQTGTPGPLPILGAGAAFGLSRKLRQRIRQTV